MKRRFGARRWVVIYIVSFFSLIKQRKICSERVAEMASLVHERKTCVVTVVRTRPQAIPLAMITMRKSTNGLNYFSFPYEYGACYLTIRL